MTAKPQLNVVHISENTYHDIPTVLRAVADCIERGEYGDTTELVLVHRNTAGEIELHGGGARMTPERAHMLAMKGARWLEDRHL